MMSQSLPPSVITLEVRALACELGSTDIQSITVGITLPLAGGCHKPQLMVGQKENDAVRASMIPPEEHVDKLAWVDLDVAPASRRHTLSPTIADTSMGPAWIRAAHLEEVCILRNCLKH